MSLISRLLKANPSAQVSDMLTGYFVIPSAKGVFYSAPAGTRAVFLGRDSSNVIDYFDIATLGNAVDFGDLSAGGGRMGRGSSQTRGVVSGVNGTASNIIEYITMATTGNSTDFGDRTVSFYGQSGNSNETRMLIIGGASSNFTQSNVIDYVTIATTGNATDFGDILAPTELGGTVASRTRAIYGGGYLGDGGLNDDTNVIQYVEIATTGNAVDFGDLVTGRHGIMATCNSPTRGVWAGGVVTNNSSANTDDIEYVTIATTGNATNFGDLLTAKSYLGGTGTHTRGVFAGGNSTVNVIQYITIATTGNAIDFGDLTTNAVGPTGVSSGHGGL